MRKTTFRVQVPREKGAGWKTVAEYERRDVAEEHKDRLVNEEEKVEHRNVRVQIYMGKE